MSDKVSLLDVRSLLALPAYVLVFLMLAFPMVLKLLYVKAVLFGIVVVVVVMAGLVRGKWTLHPSIGLWTLFLATVSFFLVIRGFFAGTPGAANTAIVYVVWPIVYTILIAGVTDRGILLAIERTLVLATLFIAIYGCTYFLTELNVVPENRFVDLFSFDWEAQAFGFHEGYVGMQFPGLNSLPFLIPFTMAALVIPGAGNKGHWGWRLCSWVALFLGLAVVLASSRRALNLVTFLTPLLVLFFRSFQPETEKHLNRRSLIALFRLLVIVVVIFAGLSSIYRFDMSVIWDHFVTGLDLSSQTIDEGAIARREQYLALLSGWYESPLLGAGHGASAYGSIRSNAMPWAYELSYLALLYQTGLFGFLAYAAGVIWIYWKGIVVIRGGGRLGESILPVLVGMTGFLIANATNPYLARFDGIWVIFLPLTFINHWLLARDRALSGASGSPRQLRERISCPPL